MANAVYRLFVERREGFRAEAARLLRELRGFLKIEGLEAVRLLNRYDVQGIDEAGFRKAATRVFSQPQTDVVFFEAIPDAGGATLLAIEYLPGQYDQRADSAEQCLSLICCAETAVVRTARVCLFYGEIGDSDMERIRGYLINPVDSREAAAEKPATLFEAASPPADIRIIEDFLNLDDAGLAALIAEKGLAMSLADIKFMQEYFCKEGRPPTETELRVLDTYWSDHCRHTTFNTILKEIRAEDGPYKAVYERAIDDYRAARAELGYPQDRPETLMDIACIGLKVLRGRGLAEDVEQSAEINACSVFVDADVADILPGEGAGEPKTERWLLMFKNETHNHPTEIEPFGGAATCIGGAIRDPLSGRAWVYQAMRVTGAADTTAPVEAALPGRLPQGKLTREAAAGFSSYGNQIGLATGQVAEYHHPGFAAKRMELGAVIAAAPASAVRRVEPAPGDVVLLVGGGTGRDGIGGASGSSKAHNAASLQTAGAEVQKGNAVEERKLQRLFRNREAASMILRCNDFGAGGVAVAVGELSAGLDINLDAVPKKYEGLDGTELAISESQERMAVVVRAEDAEKFASLAAAENLNAAVIAKVTDTGRLVMRWRGKPIVDIGRRFLDAAGAAHFAEAVLPAPAGVWPYAGRPFSSIKGDADGAGTEAAPSLKERWLSVMADPAVAGHRGLSEMFDGSIGAASILFPFGGKNQAMPEAGMAARLPVGFDKQTRTASLMAHGFDPLAMEWSPFHGAQLAVLDSLAKILALGGNPLSARLSFQEYFERMTSPAVWGKPAAALLGALQAQLALGVPSVGGKDSMSGSFGDLHVPPTLVSFAVAACDERDVRSGAFQCGGSRVFLLYAPWTEDSAPDWEAFKENAAFVRGISRSSEGGLSPVLSAYPVGAGGIGAAVLKAAFGNGFGVNLLEGAIGSIPLPKIFNPLEESGNLSSIDAHLFAPLYGSLLLEIESGFAIEEAARLANCEGRLFEIGKTESASSGAEALVRLGSCAFPLAEALAAWDAAFAGVFPLVSGAEATAKIPEWATSFYYIKEERSGKNAAPLYASKEKARPLALLPVFPGTNCEYDMARAFAIAGADVRFVVVRNNSREALEASLEELRREADRAQILALSGGFSAGDEPDGSAKFIASALSEPRVAEAVMRLLERQGLILGICNGFQALIKTGLVPFGKILISSSEDSFRPTLTFNTVGRHISRFVSTRIASALSPWAGCGAAPDLATGSVHRIPVSHGEGRLIITEDLAREFFAKGQVFSQYVDEVDEPTMIEPFNPNGSLYAIEGLTDATGRILGKMGHSERAIDPPSKTGRSCLFKNIPGSLQENIFAGGVAWFN